MPHYRTLCIVCLSHSTRARDTETDVSLDAPSCPPTGTHSGSNGSVRRDSQLSLAYSTLDAPAGLDVVVGAAGGVGLLLIALSAASGFLSFAPHRKLVSTARKRGTFALWMVLIPAAVVAFLAIPYFLPDSESLVIRTLPLTAIMFLATLAAAPGTTTVHGPDDPRSTPWPWGLAATLVVLLGFYLGVLEGGTSIDPRQWE